MKGNELKQAIKDNEILYFQVDSEIYHGVFEINRIFYDERKNIVTGVFNKDENHKEIIQLNPENIFTLPSHIVVLDEKIKKYKINKNDKFKIVETIESYDFTLRESIFIPKGEIISLYDILFDDICIAVREKDKHLVEVHLDKILPINSQEDEKIMLSSNTQNDKIIQSFKNCPICGKELKDGNFIWNDENGTINGTKICRDCFNTIFNNTNN